LFAGAKVLIKKISQDRLIVAEDEIKQIDIRQAEYVLLKAWWEQENEMIKRIPSVIRR